MIYSETTSPITLKGHVQGNSYMRFGKTTYFVRSHGYEWKRIDIDHMVGGEYYLRLKPGGEILINITGYDNIQSCFLRLRNESYESSVSLFDVNNDLYQGSGA